MPRPAPTPDRVPEAELELLSHLLEVGEAEASTLRDRLARTRPLTHASVVTLLKRLRERGLVDRRKADTGKSHVYFPTRKAGRALRGAARRLVERVFHNDTVSLVSSLYGGRTPSEDEVAELRDLVDRLEKGEDLA